MEMAWLALTPLDVPGRVGVWGGERREGGMEGEEGTAAVRM